jgi:Major Facilitator Superfamily
MFGAFRFRLPAPGWLPEGFVPPATPKRLVTQADVSVDLAWTTPQFWLLWAVLCLNVTAGIGILGQASLMCQDMFGVPAAVGGGFAGLLSLFNMAGRLFWSSTSDLTGRKAIYCVFFLLGAVLYALVPIAQKYHSVTLFVVLTALIISMYGGGFATIPAYLRDLFGTMHVGAIHGRLITAWSMAAVLGPQLVNSVSTYRVEQGIPNHQGVFKKGLADGTARSRHESPDRTDRAASAFRLRPDPVRRGVCRSGHSDEGDRA